MKTNNLSLGLKVLSLSLLTSFSSCKKDHLGQQDQTVPTDITKTFDTPTGAGYPTPCNCDIAVLDWGTDNVDLYDSEATDWTLPASKTWSFKPSTSISGGNWTATESAAPGWDNPKDVKMRLNSTLGDGTEWIAAVAGETALITTNSKIKKWSKNIGANKNPQSIEILSNGNVAVAAAAGNWVKVYSTTSSASATFTLYNAQSVIWDPINSRLWATGQLTSGGQWKIIALTVGTASAPALAIDASRTFTTDKTFLRNLAPVVGQPDKFWVSTTQGVYIYNKVSKAFTLQSGKLFNLSNANSTSNLPNGKIVQVRVAVQPPYTTDEVNIYATSATGAGSLLATHTLTGSSIYKALPLNPNYESRTYYGIATFNVRVPVDGGNRAWSVRRPLVKEMVRRYDFDIWGGQEMNGNQVGNIGADLPEYTKIGTSVDGDGTGPGTGTHSPIHYKHWRFTALTTGQFWLAPGAPTSRPATFPWGTNHYRVVTYARFQDNYTGQIFWVFNAHFDHQSSLAKQNSADMVLDQMASKIGSEPAVFVGDLNITQTSAPYGTLHNSTMLSDAYELVPVERRYAGTRGTANGWNPDHSGTNRIDHVFPTAVWDVYSHNVLNDNFNGILPSDHFPVLVEMKLP